MTATAPGAAAPSTVRASSLLYVVHGALGIVGALIAILLLPQTILLSREAAARGLQGQDTGGVDLDALATATAIGGTVLGVVIGVVFGVLTIVFARKLLRGRNWARIVLLVLAVLALPGLVAFGTAGGIGVGLLSLLSTLAAVTAAVLSLLPASAPWFRRTTLPPAAV